MDNFNRDLEHIDKKQWTLRTAIDYIKSLEDGLRTDFTQQKVKVVNLKTKK